MSTTFGPSGPDWTDDADHLEQHRTWADTDEDDYPHQPTSEEQD